MLSFHWVVKMNCTVYLVITSGKIRMSMYKLLCLDRKLLTIRQLDLVQPAGVTGPLHFNQKRSRQANDYRCPGDRHLSTNLLRHVTDNQAKVRPVLTGRLGATVVLMKSSQRCLLLLSHAEWAQLSELPDCICLLFFTTRGLNVLCVIFSMGSVYLFSFVRFFLCSFT